MKRNSLIALFFAAGLVGCGGGSGGSSTGGGTTTPEPIKSSSSSVAVSAQTNIAQGTVTGFGSVIVNGVHFDVKGAAIDIDGVPGVESDLNVGQSVRITGTINDDGVTGKATKLSAETKIRGPIESINLTQGVIVVLGQSILINADTFYEDGVTAASLKVGDVVKVSSYIGTDSKIIATRIEIKTGTEAKDLFLSGEVTLLDTAAMTFKINGTTIDYSKATIADLPNKTIKNGLLVRVHGSVVNGIFVANGNVHLSVLDLKHDGERDAKANVELNGLISDLSIPQTESLIGPTFKLGNTTVLFTTAIKIEGGTIADLANGIRVRVKGTVDADGFLFAQKLTLILTTKIDDEGLVQAIDITKKTLTLNGVTFEITADTSFNDRSKAHVRLFSLKDLMTGDFINVRGYKVAATATTPEKIVATRVERKNPSEKGKDGFKSEISGKVESVTGETIKVSGRSIKLTPSTIIVGYSSISAFVKAAVGLEVEIKGVVENDIFIARLVKVEDEDDDESEHSSSSVKSSSSVSSTSMSSSSKTSSSASSVSTSSSSTTSSSQSSTSLSASSVSSSVSSSTTSSSTSSTSSAI